MMKVLPKAILQTQIFSLNSIKQHRKIGLDWLKYRVQLIKIGFIME